VFIVLAKQGQAWLNQNALAGLLQDPAVNKLQFKGITLKAVIPNINQLHIAKSF
jgi:hypothetical protein